MNGSSLYARLIIMDGGTQQRQDADAPSRTLFFDPSLPSGARILVLTYVFLFFYFLITFIVFSVLVVLNIENIATSFIVLAGFNLLAWIIIAVSLYPLLRGRPWASKMVVTVSLVLIGYSVIWFMMGPFFAPFAFLFLLVAALSVIYIKTSDAAKKYYTEKTEVRLLHR